jgi:serine/threonine-protein kinase
LPGSRAVLFTSYTGGGSEDANVEVLSMRTGQRKTLVRGGAMPRYLPARDGSGYLLYLHQNTILAVRFDPDKLAVRGIPKPVVEDVSSITQSTPGDFDVSSNGTLVYLSGRGESERAIFWLDASGQKQPLQVTPGLYNSLRFSPDGNRLVFGLGQPLRRQELWVKDLERNTLARITSIPGASHSALWLPDGRHILFSVTNQPDAGLYWARSDGGGEPRRLLSGNQVMPASLTPDGKTVVIQSGNPFTGMEVSIGSLAGGPDVPGLSPPQRFLSAPSFPMPAFSPGGHWLAYGSAETGTDEVYVQPFPGPGEKVAISNGDGEFPVWSRNGHELFFVSGHRIMVVDYSNKGGVFAVGRPRVWSEQPILDLSGPLLPYALAPDGKRFAVLLYPDGTADQRSSLHLTFVVNFAEEVERKLRGD